MASDQLSVSDAAQFFSDFGDAVGFQDVSPLNVSEIKSFFSEFGPIWTATLERNAADPPDVNIWQISGLDHDEVRNCRVLHWLLDPNGTHCQGPRFLRCFVNQIGEQLELDSPESIKVRREVPTATGGRMDILIKAPEWLLCIEAKIHADEDHAQLRDYAKDCQRRADAKGQKFVGRLLTVEGTSDEEVNLGFLPLLWSDVVKALRLFAGKAESEDETVVARSEFICELAHQYARLIEGHWK